MHDKVSDFGFPLPVIILLLVPVMVLLLVPVLMFVVAAIVVAAVSIAIVAVVMTAGSQLEIVRRKIESISDATVHIQVVLYHRSRLLANVAVAGESEMTIFVFQQLGHRVQQVQVVRVRLI